MLHALCEELLKRFQHLQGMLAICEKAITRPIHRSTVTSRQ